MFTEADIRKEMKRLDAISGLDTSNIPIRISSRMQKQWGHCRAQRRDGKYIVTELAFADRLLRYANFEHMIETVRHEYAHAYVFLSENKNDGHGYRWKKAAVKFGAPPSRCSSKPEVAARNPQKAKYELSCPNCSWNNRYYRMSKSVAELISNSKSKRYYCPRCGGSPLKLKVN